MPFKQQHILSPLDQHGPKVYIRMALVFPVVDYQPATDTLQAALAKTSDQLPYLKGKVFEKGISERNQSFISYDPSDPAPHFEERPKVIGLPAYAELEDNRLPFPPDTFPSPIVADGVPVIAGSYTKIDGRLVVCIVAYHKVMDGKGYNEILALLATNASNANSELLINPPGPDPNEILNRRFRILGGKMEVPNDLRELDFDTILARHPEYTTVSNLIKDRLNRNKALISGISGSSNAHPGTNVVFPFSGRKIDAVKRALGGRLPPDFLTVNNILTAIIWASVKNVHATRGRRLKGALLQEPPFLGNVICYAQTEKPVAEVAFAASLDKMETLIPNIAATAEAVADLTESYLASLVHLSDINPDLSNITMSWLANGPGDLHFISWAQIKVFGLKYGNALGRPAYMRSAFMKLDGVVTMLPRRQVQEGEAEIIELILLLRGDDMGRLSADDSWRSWLVDYTP